jgi:hypothetical protein
LHIVERESLTYLGSGPLSSLEPGEPYASISSGPPELVMEIADAADSLEAGLYLLPRISAEVLIALTSSQEVDAKSPAARGLRLERRTIRRA